MNVYYSDNNAFCCSVLRQQIAAGNLYQGFVDERDIREISGDELRGYGQVHLFAGIGGFPLGFKWAGLPASMRILTGGFPCQDISYCGQGAGLTGDRSGLWSEQYRLIRCLRPDYVVVENVSALLGRGLGRIISDLAACGYDAEWDCFPAAAFGFYHDRDRVFIVAYPAERDGQPHDLLEVGEEWRASFQSRRLHSMAVATRAKRENTRLEYEPGLDRMVSRVPDQVHRIEALGNAIVPQIAQWLGERILEAERQISK